jgi:hypothetical protein
LLLHLLLHHRQLHLLLHHGHHLLNRLHHRISGG